MLVDGRGIAATMLAVVAGEVALMPESERPRLAIITCAPNFETKKYLALKKRKAAEAGITIEVVELPEETTTTAVVAAVEGALVSADGIVVQLPMPPHINREAVLQAVPVTHDPDGFSYESDSRACLPPVVAAVVAIARAYEITFTDKRVVIMGQGRLVGAPVLQYLTKLGIPTQVITEASTNTLEVLATADIIITGVGKPGLLTSSMVKEGVVVVDAGTSEEGGMLVGDADPDIALKAALFTPVPGGIGPITVAALLANVMILAKQQ